MKTFIKILPVLLLPMLIVGCNMTRVQYGSADYTSFSAFQDRKLKKAMWSKDPTTSNIQWRVEGIAINANAESVGQFTSTLSALMAAYKAGKESEKSGQTETNLSDDDLPTTSPATEVVKPPKTTSSGSLIAGPLAEAKATGKPLIVINSAEVCGICRKFHADLTTTEEGKAFLARTDIIVVNTFGKDWAEQDATGVTKWTGGGAAPIVRITQFDTSTGEVLCDNVFHRPGTTIAQILKVFGAALSSCTIPE